MAHDVTVQVNAETAAVVKRAWGADAGRLRAEGERLRAAAHPGVVEVLESSGTDDAWELRLAHEGRPLAAVGRLVPARVGWLAAALASTVADLHEAGVVHGRIDAEHVLVGSQGRPVLCGFGAPGDPVAEPSDDVAAIGALLGSLLDGPAELEPIPGSRWSRPSRSEGWVRRSLLTIADQAMAEPASRRPSARRLAESLATIVPSSSPPPVARRGRLRTGRVVRIGALVLPLTALAALVGGLALRSTPQEAVTSSPATTAQGPPPGPTGPRAAAPGPDSGSEGGSPPPSPTAPGAVGRPALSPTTGPASPASCLSPGPEVEEAPTACGEPMSVQGNLIRVGSRSYAAGRPGDAVVLGDWDCDGTSTPAVLRPATGEVFVFAGWPVDADLVVRAVRVVGGGETLAEVASEADPACSALVVAGADGPLVTLAGQDLS